MDSNYNNNNYNSNKQYGGGGGGYNQQPYHQNNRGYPNNNNFHNNNNFNYNNGGGGGGGYQNYQGYPNYNNNNNNNNYQRRGNNQGNPNGGPMQSNYRRPRNPMGQYPSGPSNSKGFPQPYQPYPQMGGGGGMQHMKVNRHRQIQDCHFPRPPPSVISPPNENTIKVLSYNILSDHLLQDSLNLYINLNYSNEKEVPFWMDWKYRLDVLFTQLTNTGGFSTANSSQKEHIDADVVCLQEVDNFADIDERLKSCQFKGIFAERDQSHKDGCAIFYRDDRLCLIDYTIVEYTHFNNDDLEPDHQGSHEDEEEKSQNDKENIAIIAIFKKRNANELSNNKPICVVNTQIGSTRKHEIKLSQTHFLTSEIEKTIEELAKDSENKITSINTCPTIVCGDFNSNPQSVVYQFLKDAYYKIEPFKYKFWSQAFSTHPYSSNTFTCPSESQNTMNIRHNIKLKSSYGEILNGKEPMCTIIHKRARETVDYIWYSSDSMNLKRTLPLSKEICQNAQLPNKCHPSDHLMLAAEFSII